MNNFDRYNDPKNTEVFPPGKLFRISFDSLHLKFKLSCFNRKDLDDIIEKYSDTNPQYFYLKQYGYNVDKTISVINQFGFFPCGLLFDILEYLKIQYGSLNILAISDECKNYINDYITPLKKWMKKLGKTDIEITNVADDTGRNNELIEQGKNPYVYRDYQLNAIHELITTGYGRGLIELPTASGKSLCLANFVWNINRNISRNFKYLLLVPNKQLVSQMYNDFIDYGFDKRDITRFTAGLKKNERFNKDAKVIIANRQFVFTNKDILPNIDVLICDEAHQTLAEATKKFIEELPAPVKIGCSGSIPKTKYDRWQIIGLFGKIVYHEKITDLQERGFISKLKIFQINVHDSVVENDRNYLFNLNPYKKYSPDENGYSEIPFNAAHDAEHEYYEKYYKELYKPALEYVSTFDENTLILFDRIEFGKRLTEMSNDIFKGKKIHYIDGSVPVSDRLEITKQMETSGDNVLFAEFATFSTGVNVKRLTNLVFVSSSKSFPRILQSIGRTLRLHTTKTEARIFDVNFQFKYSQKHLKERLAIYKSAYNKTPDKVIDIRI